MNQIFAFISRTQPKSSSTSVGLDFSEVTYRVEQADDLVDGIYDDLVKVVDPLLHLGRNLGVM